MGHKTQFERQQKKRSYPLSYSHAHFPQHVDSSSPDYSITESIKDAWQIMVQRQGFSHRLSRLVFHSVSISDSGETKQYVFLSRNKLIIHKRMKYMKKECIIEKV